MQSPRSSCASSSLGGSAGAAWRGVCEIAPLIDAITGSQAINYGSDKVRFLQPVKVGSRIRAHAVLKSVDERAPGQVLVKTRFTVEIEGEDKPAMVAEILSLFVTG